jgi:hypothetical protein
MKFHKEVVELGFEFSHPSSLMVILHVEKDVPKFNVFECLYNKLKSLFVKRSRVALFARCTPSIFRASLSERIGFQPIALADRVWDLTHKYKIKDRYSPESKLTQDEMVLFDNCPVWTKDQLKKWMKIDTGIGDDVVI